MTVPANAQAATATDDYRRRALQLREATTAAVVARWQALDLDGDLEEQLGLFEGQAVQMLTAAQVAVSAATIGYLDLYMARSGVTPQRAAQDAAAHAGVDDEGGPLELAVHTAAAALLWRLVRRQGRAMGMASGLARSVRVSRTSIQAAARATLADGMAAEPRVTRWVRVVSANPCGGCLALAGQTSTSERVGLPYHNGCACTAEPVLSGVADTVRRPTGQQMFDRMSPAQQAALFAGTGGAEKAAAVARDGVAGLAATDASGHLVEATLAAFV